MNYKKIHDNIINNARSLNRSKETGIYELHHIIMTSVGGTDDPDNLVLLTPKEHFIIHYLLWKIHPDNRKYRDPIFMFKHKGAENSRLYEAARLSHIHEMKTNNPSTYLSEDSKKKKSDKLKAYIKTDLHRAALSKSGKGKQIRLGAVLSDNSKSKISQSVKKWHKEVGVSDETREKLRLSSTGRKHSKESLEKQKQKALNRQKFACPHCNKIYDAGNLKQHMMRNGFSVEDVELIKMKPEGWTVPSHEGNHGNLPK